MAADSVPVPPQMPVPVLYDFRRSATGPKGYKESRKRKLEETAEQVLADEAERAMRGDEEPSTSQPAKRTKLQNRVSGKNWKGSAPRMSSTKGDPKLRSSWDQKMKIKAEATLFKEQKAEARAEVKERLTAERERRKAVKERKEANQRDALKKVGQKITNISTLKRMMKSKKQRKKLVTADIS